MQLLEWLDNEIEYLKNSSSDNPITSGAKSEAVRIRQKIKNMGIEDIAEEICDKYCRFPEVYDDKERMAQEKCSKCPLERLLNG